MYTIHLMENNKKMGFNKSRTEMSEKWEEICNDTRLPNRDLNHILDKLHHKINITPSTNTERFGGNRLFVWFSRVAAILIIPLLLTGVYFHHEWRELRFEAENSFVEIYSPYGARTKFVLPDGTKGVLNGDSKLKYAMNFNKNRYVEVSGEAYFDVVHNEKQPFVVDIHDVEVKVLGTRFNVVNYADEDESEVILESGKIELQNRINDYKTMMEPNQKIIFSKKTGAIQKYKVNAKQLTAWKDGRLVFRDERFADVAKRLSRWFNVDVVIEDESLKNYRYRATFEDERLEEILMLLKLTAPINYKLERRKQLHNSTFSKQKVTLFLQ